MEFSVVWEIKTSWGIGPKKSNFLNGLNHIIWLWYWLQRLQRSYLTINVHVKRSVLGHNLLPRVLFWEESGFQTRSELITGYLSGILRKQNKSTWHKESHRWPDTMPFKMYWFLSKPNSYCTCLWVKQSCYFPFSQDNFQSNLYCFFKKKIRNGLESISWHPYWPT